MDDERVLDMAVEDLLTKVEGDYMNMMVLHLADELFKQLDAEVMGVKDLRVVQEFREWIDDYIERKGAELRDKGIDMPSLTRRALLYTDAARKG